jgi:hypothetical protein
VILSPVMIAQIVVATPFLLLIGAIVAAHRKDLADMDHVVYPSWLGGACDRHSTFDSGGRRDMGVANSLRTIDR